jgi:hypothetical protein
MKKIVLMLVLIGVTALTTLAQKTSGGNFSVGLDLGAITGSYSNVTSLAIGASLKYNHPIADKTFLTGSVGYTYLPYSNEYKVAVFGFVNQSGEGFIPLKAGIKYFFTNVFYGEAQIGAAISTNSGGGAAFAYAPGIGTKFGSDLDFGIRYEAWSKTSTISQVALRIAYSF